MRLRLRSFHAFLRTTLPAPPARLLEVGCGDGELALALVGDGYDVTAIDPEAPGGAPFRRVRLEDFDGEVAVFDAVVASLALHHVPDLAAAFSKIERLLRPGGRLVLGEFGKERIAGATARWYHSQRRALAAVGRDDAEIDANFETWYRQWRRDRAGVHPSPDLLAAVRARLREVSVDWTPYLYSYRLDDSLEPAERALVDTGEIEAVGFHYVGERTG
jgi:SAM-dependent methyltransferase